MIPQNIVCKVVTIIQQGISDLMKADDIPEWNRALANVRLD